MRGSRPAAVPRPLVPLTVCPWVRAAVTPRVRPCAGPGGGLWGAAVPLVGPIAETRRAAEPREHPCPGRLCRAPGACGGLFVAA